MIGTLAETDLGKRRIVHICTDRGDQAKKILPALTNMLDMSDTETVMNAAGTMGTLVRLYYMCLYIYQLDHMLLLYSLQVKLNSFIKTLKMTSAQVVEISFQQQQFFSEIPLPR